MTEADRNLWHPWQALPPLPRAVPFTPAVLAELLDGGQAFRWQRRPDGSLEGGWLHHHLRIRISPAISGALEFATPSAAGSSLAGDRARERTAATAALHAYLSGPPADEDALPWRSDPHLAACLRACPGLRILRQPFGETLLGFVCSATKQIVQIKRMMSLLASRHGPPSPSTPPPEPRPPSPLHPRSTCQSLPDNASWHSLPDWPALASVSEAQLRACGLGFRARHVAGIAAFLAARPGWLETTELAPYPEAKARLLELPGVGEKVADCVLLFGAGRLEAFPVDTWIVKAMARRYGLAGWPPAHIAHFGRLHFGPQAGLAQQYLFAFERAAAR